MVKDDFVSHMEKECIWRHYNLSIQRIFGNIEPYGRCFYFISNRVALFIVLSLCRF